MSMHAPGERTVVQLWRACHLHLLRLVDFSPSALTFLGAVGFAASSLAHDEWKWFLFSIACFVSTGGLAFSYRNLRGARFQKRLWEEADSARKGEHEEFAHRADTRLQELRTQIDVLVASEAEITSFLLEQVLSELGIGDHEARASVYIRTGTGYISLLARFSHNGRFRVPGNGGYQLERGAVARGWERPYLDMSLPRRRGAWNSYMTNIYGIPEKIVSELRMQSRSLAAVPLMLPSGATAVTAGVLLIEHLKPLRVNGDTQEALIGAQNLRALAALCKARHSYMSVSQ